MISAERLNSLHTFPELVTSDVTISLIEEVIAARARIAELQRERDNATDLAGSRARRIDELLAAEVKYAQQLAELESNKRALEGVYAIAVKNQTELSQQLAEMRGALDSIGEIVCERLRPEQKLAAIAEVIEAAALAPTSQPSRGKCSHVPELVAALLPMTQGTAWLTGEHVDAAKAAIDKAVSAGCKMCGDSRMVQDVVDSVDPEWSQGVEYPCPDCAQPERQGALRHFDNGREPNAAETIEALEFIKKHGTDCSAGAWLDRAIALLKPSPPQDDIVAGLRKMLTDNRMLWAEERALIDRAIAALGEKGAKRRKYRCVHGVHQDNTCRECD